jgi:hypothetical protein
VLLVPVLLWWLASLLGVVDVDLPGGGDGFEADLDLGTDGLDVDTDGGLIDGLLAATGLAAVPATVALGLVVVFGWFVAFLATAALQAADLPTAAAVALGLVALAAAFAVGTVAASLAARPLAPLFATTHAESRSAFVGRLCTVRTERVTADFGQAEAADPDGATVLVPVRVADADADGPPLRRGDRALIVDYDPAAEVFFVTPAGVLDDPGDTGGTAGAPGETGAGPPRDRNQRN